jgi:hypothetical protein
MMQKEMRQKRTFLAEAHSSSHDPTFGGGCPVYEIRPRLRRGEKGKRAEGKG